MDSFFLPGGILDPEEEEDGAPEETTNEVPSLWGGAPPENPWAIETRPSELQSAWNSETCPAGSATASPAAIIGPAVPVAADPTLSQPTVRVNDNLGAPGPIGNASYEPPSFAPGPLHSSDRLRETLHASLVEASVPPVANQHISYPPPQSSQPLPHPSSGFASKNKPGDSAIPPPFRPPPGFTQQPPQTRIREEAPAQPILDEEENEDSIRSDSSVPHELYDRESLSASSLSGSSSIDVDESTATPNTSSMLDETPNNSSFVEDTMKHEISESRDVAVVERTQHVAAKGDREEIAEKSSPTLPEAPQESLKPSKPIPSPRSPLSPNAKARNRRGGKAKRNKPSSTAKTKSTVCHVKKPTPSYMEYVQAAWDWTVGLLQHLWTVLLSGLKAVFVVFKSTASFWKTLFRSCRMILFTLIRTAGVFVSFSVCVVHNAYLEATQEWRVAWYFAVTYFTPHCMSLLMKSVILPHWTPHLVACVVLIGLCRQPYARVSYYSETDGADASSRQNPTNGTAGSDEEKKQETTARDVSKVILRQILFNLPVVFFLEGFSNEIGMVMALDGAGRIITAYIILILRLGMLFSPMAWLCGAIQILVAFNFGNWIPFIDMFVVLVGLASIRYCKFLERCNQAAQDIRAKEK